MSSPQPSATRETVVAVVTALDTANDRLAVLTLWQAALRVGELVTLRPDHLIVRHSLPFLQVDGGRGVPTRFVPIPILGIHLARLAQEQRRAHESAGIANPSEHRLFTRTRAGRPAELGSDSLRRTLRRAAVAAGIDPPVPSALRRGAMAEWRAGGMPLDVLATVCGYVGAGLLNPLIAPDPQRCYGWMLHVLRPLAVPIWPPGQGCQG
jgi:integrase